MHYGSPGSRYGDKRKRVDPKDAGQCNWLCHVRVGAAVPGARGVQAGTGGWGPGELLWEI